MTEFSECLSSCLQDVEAKHNRDGSLLRGFRYAFAISAFIWAAGAALVISGCASGPSPTFTSAQALHVARAGKMRAHCGDIPLPPPRFDHAPTIRTFVSYVPYGQVGVICRAHGVRGSVLFADRNNNAAALMGQVTDGDFEMQACSWTDVAKLGFVVLPERSSGDISQEWEACALRHEYAHINGWTATHPDAHYEDS